MKYRMVPLLLIVVLLAAPASLVAQNVLEAQSTGTKLWVTAGVKGWFGSWNVFADEKVLITDQMPLYDQYGNLVGYGSAYLEGKESATGFLGGPYLSIKAGQFTGTVMFQPTISSFQPKLPVKGYDQYGNQITVYDARTGQPVGDLTTTIKRQDINLIAMYAIVPEFSVFGNLKFLNYNFTYNFMNVSGEDKVSYTGFGGGVNGTYRFPGSPAYIYGYLGAIYNTTSTSGYESETVVFFDGGVGYRFIAGGLRVESGSKTGTKTIIGPILSLYYTF